MSKSKPKRRCLNCGEKTTGNFCPHCGQPAATARLSTWQFLGQTVVNLLRLNRGFLFTARTLVATPWRVIRDYIHGRRVNYTAPVQMLIVLCLITLVEEKLLNLPASIDNFSTLELVRPGSQWADAVNAAVRFYLSSPTLQYLTFFLPCSLVARAVYRRRGAARFNAAEYLVATIYMVNAMLVFGLLTAPIDALGTDLSAALNALYTVIMASAVLVKAFPCGGRVKDALHLVGFLLLSAAVYAAIFIAVGLLIACSV